MLESEYYADYMESKGEGAVKNVLKYAERGEFPELNFPHLLKPFVFEAGSPNNFPAASNNNGADLIKKSAFYVSL